MKPPVHAPKTHQELTSRAAQLAGWTLGELATIANIAIPSDFRRHKGWSGQLIERWLGAEAGSKPTQDFPELGVELKTIPIDANGMPLETTYVCYAHLLPVPGETWQTSSVYNKLKRVLWVPIEGLRDIPVSERQLGTPFSWSPDEQQQAVLQQDWEELNELIISGLIESITSRHGEALQLRPKAANGAALTDAIGSEGQKIRTRPRGYYLKKGFTQQILQQAFLL